MGKLKFQNTGKNALISLGGYGNVEAAKNYCKVADISNDNGNSYDLVQGTGPDKEYKIDRTVKASVVTNKNTKIEYFAKWTDKVRQVGFKNNVVPVNKSVTLSINGSVVSIPASSPLMLNSDEDFRKLIENLVIL